MKSTVKRVLVFMILMGCVAPDFSQSNEQKKHQTAAFNHPDETLTAEKNREDTRKQDLLGQSGRLRSFLFLYCQAYESRDIEKFSAFFAPDATENNRPFNEFLPRYRRNFGLIKSLRYRIDLISYSAATETGNISLKGKYFIRYLLNKGTWKENNGIISMELMDNGESYLVRQLNYAFLSLD